VGDLVEGKRVRVLPTRTLGQGLAAAVLFQENADADELFAEMEAAARGSLTLEVTRASRDVVLDGVSVREGDAIGLVDGTLATSARRSEERRVGKECRCRWWPYSVKERTQE